MFYSEVQSHVVQSHNAQLKTKALKKSGNTLTPTRSYQTSIHSFRSYTKSPIPNQHRKSQHPSSLSSIHSPSLDLLPAVKAIHIHMRKRAKEKMNDGSILPGKSLREK